MKSYLPKLFQELASCETEEERRAYEKFIMTFSSPLSSSYRIGQKISKMKEFDLVDHSSVENYVGGHLHKRFVMLDKSYFENHLKLMKKGSSFQSYLSDLKNAPEYLSVLIKSASTDKQLLCEVFVPYICNEFDIPTVCNSTCKDAEDNEFVASLDFIKPNERFFSLYDVCGYEYQLGVDVNLENALKVIRKFMVAFEREQEMTLSAEDKRALEERFVSDYLLRVCFLADCDFSTKNVGFLFDEKKNSLRTAPNFDFEYTFMCEMSVEEDVLFAYKHYPEVVDDFMNKLKDFYKPKRVFETPRYLDMLAKIEDGAHFKMMRSIIEKQASKILKLRQNMKEKQ